jgi:hypothetical protein
VETVRPGRSVATDVLAIVGEARIRRSDEVVGE